MMSRNPITSAAMSRAGLRVFFSLLVLLLVVPSAHALEWKGSVGLGYDSNAFRSPDVPYTDLPAATVINPEVKSGFYVPAKLFVGHSPQPGGLLWQYRFDGELYLDPDLDNANNFRHDLVAGGEWNIKHGKGDHSRWRLTGRLTRQREIYVDRDSGVAKLGGGGVDVSDRDTYTGTAVEGEYERSRGTLGYGLSALLETRDYEDPVAVRQNDHDITQLTGHVGVELGPATDLDFGLDYKVKAYDDRRARDLTGAKVAETREYVYTALKTTLRHEVTRAVALKLQYRLRQLADQYVGYEDYTEHRVRAGLAFSRGAHDTELEATWLTRDYDNALAFDDITGGPLSYDRAAFDLSHEYQRSGGNTLFAKFKWKGVSTNDTRYEYDRYRVILGATWRY